MEDQLRIAVVTCAEAAARHPDDRLLLRRLSESGASAFAVNWDDPEVDWATFDRAILRSTWDYHQRIEEFLRWLPSLELCGRAWNTTSLVRWNVDKAYLLELSEKGVRIVPTVLLEGGEEQARRIALDRGWHDLVLKPRVSASAWRTFRVQGSDWPSELVEGPFGNKMMMQPFLSSVTRGEVSVIAIDGQLTHAVRKTPRPGEYRCQAEFGGIAEVIEIDDALARAARDCLAALPEAPLYARIDLLLDAENEWLLGECELIEPVLFLELSEAGLQRLADCVVRRVTN